MPSQKMKTNDTRGSYSARIERAMVRAGNRMADLPIDGGDLPVDRSSRLLAWVLLLLICLMILTAGALVWLEHTSPQRLLLHLIIVAVNLLVLCASFVLNRKRLSRLAARVAVLGSMAGTWAALLLDQQIRTALDGAPLYFSALPIMLAAFLLSSGETFLISLLQLFGLIWLLEWQSAWQAADWQPLFIFIAFVSLLGLAASRMQQTNLRLIEQQNQKLLENEAAFKDMSTRDSLTGLYNRHYLMETLPREISRVARRKSELGVIMIDIDRFKEINDQYGHAVADDLLRLVGERLAGKIRASDIACRFGGDAYVLVMPDASSQATFERADSIRADAPEWQFEIGSLVLADLTLTCGVACYPRNGTDGQTLLRIAGQSLDQARQTGRSQTGPADS